MKHEIIRKKFKCMQNRCRECILEITQLERHNANPFAFCPVNGEKVYKIKKVDGK